MLWEILVATAFAGEPVPEWNPTADEQVLIRALSLRDASPPCAEMEAWVPDPVASLRNVVEHMDKPPAAPMRAASCGSLSECEEELAKNLMYPETVCTDGFCEWQEELTPEQVAVLHRYVGSP
jgi:hypothetical protein